MMMNSILIQVDFDNTLTKGNVSELIHEKFGPFNWPEIYENYKNKLISVEESNIYSFEYLDISKTDLNKFVQNNVEFREGFLEFYTYITNLGLDFKIVSSGVDFYIYSALSVLDIDIENFEIITGKSIFNNKGINVKYYDPQYNKINSNNK